jgi:parvulin-like peptidyl-prolyl isomerase
MSLEELLAGIDFSAKQWKWLAKHGMIQRVLEACILEQAGEAIHLSDCDRELALKNYVQEKGLEEQVQKDEFLWYHFLSADDLQLLAEMPMRIERLMDRDFLPGSGSRYLARKSYFDRVVYSLLRVKDEYLARELYLRIAQGEADFGDIAFQYSQGSESQTRGIVGPVSPMQGHPRLSQILKASQPGKLLEPQKVDEWWIVLRLETYESQELDDQMRKLMARELMDEWLQAEVKRFREQLAQSHSIGFQFQSHEIEVAA